MSEKPPDTNAPTAPVQGQQRDWNVRCFVRCVLYAHVLGTVFSGLFSYLDQQRWYVLPAIVFSPAFLSLFVCPLLILAAVISCRLDRRDAAVVCAAEAYIECSQMLVLLPAVS
ncbi:MAG: hypothetical protein ABFD16_06505 [Thermoguttaceae bacterium]